MARQIAQKKEGSKRRWLYLNFIESLPFDFYSTNIKKTDKGKCVMIVPINLKLFTSQGWSIFGRLFDPIKWQDKSPKKGGSKKHVCGKKASR
jgi:hypothetical protein